MVVFTYDFAVFGWGPYASLVGVKTGGESNPSVRISTDGGVLFDDVADDINLGDWSVGFYGVVKRVGGAQWVRFEVPGEGVDVTINRIPRDWFPEGIYYYSEFAEFGRFVSQSYGFSAYLEFDVRTYEDWGIKIDVFRDGSMVFSRTYSTAGQYLGVLGLFVRADSPGASGEVRTYLMDMYVKSPSESNWRHVLSRAVRVRYGFL